MRRSSLPRLLRLGGVLLWCVVAAVQAASTPNQFHGLLGKSDAETAQKIGAAWQHLFYGRDDLERVYFPVGADLAYIADIGSSDVRSEGMSYGMMIAVQTNHREEFDRLWKWAKTYMYQGSGPRRGYFAWHCAFNGKQLDPGSASDGEEWFAMALLFASHRWGDRDGIFNYNAEAQALLREMIHKDAGEITSIFDRTQKQVVFVPNRTAGTFTDPSYHLPAFYELWARWDEDAADRAFWTDVAKTSRAFFKKAAHPRTGLMPEYAYFDGRPHTSFAADKGDFRFDAWRVIANVAFDYAWWQADRWEVEQSNRVLGFLAAQGPNCANQFMLEGRPLSTDTSLGLTAMAAVGSLAADPEIARPFVQRLWDSKPPTGKWRYYDGLLYFLALLEVGGEFQIYAPRTSPSSH